MSFDATGATGPVPVVAGYGYTNGWGTISNLPSGQVKEPPFYMVFSGGSFAFYRNGQFVGRPVNAGYTGDRLWVEIDQRFFDPIIGTNPTQVIQLNWITMTSIDATDLGKSYDGFGRTGREYFNIESLLTSHQWVSGIEPAPEEPAYGPLENTSPDADTDITGWQVQVRINSGT
ncbi:MAG TPA: hypothetical protein VGL77_02350 [Armatimonadota bacterium]